MTRREEIVKATKECKEGYVGLGRHLTTEDIADAFEEGAEWANKTMIDKACAWLWYEIYERIEDERIKEALMDDNYRANLVSAFRKAMEE